MRKLGIMLVPENIEQVHIRNFVQIEIELDCLAVISEIVIGRIYLVSTRIPYPGSIDSF